MSKAWFLNNWMYAGFVAGVLLLAVVPVFAGALTLPLLLVYLQLPAYMFHQLEEHTDDRFRRYINETTAGGHEALTMPAVVLINVGGVWIVDLIALYLAGFVRIGLGLIAIYLMLVNAIVHIVGALARRRYNPGLATAVALFLPLGIYSLIVVARAPGVTLTDHAVGLGVAILIHVAIAVHVKRRAAALAAAA